MAKDERRKIFQNYNSLDKKKKRSDIDVVRVYLAGLISSMSGLADPLDIRWRLYSPIYIFSKKFLDSILFR